MEEASPTLVQSPTAVGPETASATFSPADSNFSFPHDAPTSIPTANRRRKSSTKGVNSAVIKRSMSSPNVRALSSASELAGSLAEKRRNKLGYHRTSVACVHCRRRKIRCLLATDDQQNRCSNCIRLKKECNFFPVDQQPTIDRRLPTGSKGEGAPGENDGSSSSSPTIPPGPGLDTMNQFNQLPFGIETQPYPGALAPSALSPPGSAALFHSPLEYPEAPAPVGWEPGFYDSPGGHSTPDGGPPNNFWMKPETPLTPSYSPFSAAPPGPPFPVRNIDGAFPSPMGPGGAPKPDPEWHQPTRSMSYSHLEGLASQHGQHGPEAFNGIYHQELRRNTSADMPPPPSLRNSSIGSSSASASVPDPSMIPLSAPPLTPGGNPQSPYPFASAAGGPTTAWASLPNQNAKGWDFGGNCYNESTLAKVQEEEVPPHFVDDGIGLYSADAH